MKLERSNSFDVLRKNFADTLLNRRKSRLSFKFDVHNSEIPPVECKFDLEWLKVTLVSQPRNSLLPLLSEDDSIVHAGKVLYRREDDGLFGVWSELYLVLLNNHLLLIEPRQESGSTKYILITRPILLDLLVLSNFSDAPTKRISGIFNTLKRGGGKISPSSTVSLLDARIVYPFTIDTGRQEGPYTLYVETAESRDDWGLRLQQALRRHTAQQASKRVYEIRTLVTEFPFKPENGTLERGKTYTGKVNFLAVLIADNGRELMSVGADEGVWIGLKHKPPSMRRVLRLKSVTQIAAIQDCGIFLVLAEKTLLAYHIESLVTSSPHNLDITQTPQKLNRASDVLFFAVGQSNGRTLVVYMSKKGSESVFRVLEPDNVKVETSGSARPRLPERRSDWFRIYRDFSVPYECHGVAFLESRLVLFCEDGFRIMDMFDFQGTGMTITSTYAARRPLGIFVCGDSDFLLCYDQLGLYVDRQGKPNPSKPPVEWEGTAERVARQGLHILLFTARFVEVRGIETGGLCQIMRGDGFRCISDGQDAERSDKVYGVMRCGNAANAETQRVFELALAEWHTEPSS